MGETAKRRNGETAKRRMGVWAYGRMGVWAYGRMGVWAYGRIGMSHEPHETQRTHFSKSIVRTSEPKLGKPS
jgi:hypothetical protein